MLREIEVKSAQCYDVIETIYFGGGTPSLLEVKEIDNFIQLIIDKYKTSSNLEITLEANPDDLKLSKLKEIASTMINRLSIGVQSLSLIHI